MRDPLMRGAIKDFFVAYYTPSHLVITRTPLCGVGSSDRLMERVPLKTPLRNSK